MTAHVIARCDVISNPMLRSSARYNCGSIPKRREKELRLCRMFQRVLAFGHVHFDFVKAAGKRDVS